MNLYAESSAVLAWLLDEPKASEVSTPLAEATEVITSELTLVECDRAIVRLVCWSQITEQDADALRTHLGAATSRWTVTRLEPRVIERARQRFPAEPIRSLDALHLASALIAREDVPNLAILSLDERIRVSGAAVDFEILP